MAAVAHAQTPESTADQAAGVFSGALAQAAMSLEGGDANSALLGLTNRSIDYVLEEAFAGAPAWLRRVEVDAQIETDGEPSWSILTVQPLYQSEHRRHTVFTQLSQRRYDYLGDDRDVTNIGFGYRRTLLHDTLLVGANAFFDYEWERRHRRLGVGVEARWGGFDLFSNYYNGIGGLSSTGLDAGVQERVLDGFDVELGTQVPYMPWARLYVQHFQWNTKSNAEDIEGEQVSLEADIHQNFYAEFGWRDDNFSDEEGFAKVTFRFGLADGDNRPVAMSSEFISPDFWLMRDMRDYTLDKVRRENRIIVERLSSGVVITRGS